MENPFSYVVLRIGEEMERVFAYIVNEKNERFDPIYFGATYLHPQLRHRLTEPSRRSRDSGLLPSLLGGMAFARKRRVSHPP